MLRTVRSTWVWTLSQRRYATLAAIMVLLACACIGAGTFELHRFHEKRHDNSTLKANYHAAAVPLTTRLVPLSGQGPAPGALAVRYRTVTVRGVWDATDEQYLGNVSHGNDQGFAVLTPLRTSGGTLLVTRGFVAASASGNRPGDVPAPPTGTVSVRGRLYTTSSSDDGYGRLPAQEISAVNPADQATRLRTPVYAAYVQLTTNQASTTGLDPLPGPDLSNPTGGAGELQLLSYVVQWYVFALLALLAPFAFARADAKEARRRFLGLDDDDVEFDLAARAADIPPALAGADRTELEGRPGPAELSPAVRERAELARTGADVRWTQAERLADRYGRSLGPRPDADPTLRRAPARREAAPGDTSNAAHRSGDEYHGTYNDYLWSLAMADGNLPEVVPETRVEPLIEPVIEPVIDTTRPDTEGGRDAAERGARPDRDD